MVKYHKVGTSFILADFIQNLNEKSSKPRQKKYGFIIGYCSGEKTLWIYNIDYSYISWFLEPAQLPIKKILHYLYFFLRQ